jgi:outer membrane immunogenic protein
MEALMTFRTLMAAAALLGIPGVAVADGPPSRAAYSCCEQLTWSGVYAGFHAGGAWGDTGWRFPFAEFYNTAPGQHFSTSPDGAIVGGHLGINRQIGMFLIGAEVAYAGSNMQETLTGPVTAALPLDRFKTEISDLITVTGRLGLAADKFLLYGKAGYANSNVDLKTFSGPPVAGVSASISRREDGWIVGGGLEYRIMRSLVFGVEYNYVSLDGGRFTTTTGGTVPGLPFNVDLDSLHMHTVTARLSILLDTGPTAPQK